MGEAPRIVYVGREDATPDAERSALAAAYSYLLKSKDKKKAAPASRPDDAERRSSDGARNIIPERP
jgi:hypothetical protein